MILISNLVLPGPETASGQDVLGPQVGESLVQDTIPLQAGGGISVVEPADIGADDLLLGLKQVGVDQALDAIGEQRLLLDWLVGGLRDLEHDRPVRPRLCIGGSGLFAVGQLLGGKLDVFVWLVERRVVGEDRGAVERAVVLDKVQLSGGLDVVWFHSPGRMKMGFGNQRLG